MKEKQKQAITNLRKTLKRNKELYTTVKHVSQSGMFRVVDVFIMRKNKPINISCIVARALNWKHNDTHWGIGMKGCGMDMCFHLVYSLSSTLYGISNRGGYTLKQVSL